MTSAIWANVHGATTHFPLALAVCSAACDAAGRVLAGRPVSLQLRAAGYWTLLLGALGSLGAIFSGVAMTQGSVLGHGTLRMHHLFVWPAFALLIALATWRLQVERKTTNALPTTYLIGVGVLCALMLTAGYWGGELMTAI
jgi:uncharacterized membrane protein